MSTQANSVKTADVANTVSGNNTLTTITNTQSTTSVEKSSALSGRQYDKVRAASDSGTAPVPGEKAAAKSGGGDDLFSGIARVITSAVNVAMAVVNPLSAVANAADTIAKATNKKA